MKTEDRILEVEVPTRGFEDHKVGESLSLRASVSRPSSNGGLLA